MLGRRPAPAGLSQGAQLVVMARWPVPGRCKTRLAGGIGVTRAAAVQQRLIEHTLVVAAEARASLALTVVVAVAGIGLVAAERWRPRLGCDRIVTQGQGGLGLRLQRQLLRALREEAGRVVLVGSDLPDLCAADLLQAFDALERCDLVLGPACDGGYWLIGLTGNHPALFSGIAWGSDQVLQQTEQAASSLGLVPRRLACRQDLDRPCDLRRWR
jgi:rSAM/selenodomain-associated transferase 1